MRGLRPAVRMAAEVGENVGRGAVLLGRLPHGPPGRGGGCEIPGAEELMLTCGWPNAMTRPWPYVLFV